MSEWEREGEEERASEISCFVRTCVEHEWSRGRGPRLRLTAACWEEAAEAAAMLLIPSEERTIRERLGEAASFVLAAIQTSVA